MPQIGACSFNGLAFGVGSKIHVAQWPSIDEMAPVRSFDADASGADGGLAGRDLLAQSDHIITFAIAGDTPTDYDAQLLAFKAAFIRTDAELPLTFFDNTRLFYGRVRKRSGDYDATTLRRSAQPSVLFHCTDPRMYNATQTSLSTGLGNATGGLVWPATFPTTFGSGSAGGQVTAVNNGDYITYPVLTIAGPVDNPIVDHVELGLTLGLTISLGGSDVLVIDTDPRAHTVTLNGTANRRNTLNTPQWFGLRPGTQTIRYRNNGAFTASTLQVAYRDAWA